MDYLMDAYGCWRCWQTFKTWAELFDHKENDCTEINWSDAAEKW